MEIGEEEAEDGLDADPARRKVQTGKPSFQDVQMRPCVPALADRMPVPGDQLPAGAVVDAVAIRLGLHLPGTEVGLSLDEAILLIPGIETASQGCRESSDRPGPRRG
jgi:hypothetical protein